MILAMIQGIPISSAGHAVIGTDLLNRWQRHEAMALYLFGGAVSTL